ncbi:DUF4416 family protein [Salinispira pacifica]
MGTPHAFRPVKLVVPALVADPDLLPDIRHRLSSAFGPIDFESEPFPFDFTDYYRAEMGERLLRIFFSHRSLIDPQTLPDAKLETNRIEQELAAGSGRRVNLDPGALDLGRFTLATTKDHAHRIPLRSGIYGEVTLLCHRSGFEALPWTYPDYRSPQYQQVLRGIREIYRQQLNCPSAG